MLHVHRAERADVLADHLGEALIEPLDDPFAPDVIAVPTRGIERWLTQRLSTRLGASGARRDGVCANIEFPFLGRLVVGALAAVTGIEPDEDPWLPQRSVWPLLDVIDESLGESWLRTLKQHLDGTRAEPGGPTRRFGAARHIADLFDRYAVHRPDMLRSWATAADVDEWQAELWRRLRARIGQPSPAERLAGACEQIRAEPDMLELPPRLSLFGLTRLPRSYLDVLAAIAHARGVHLFLLHPSPALWRRVDDALKAAHPSARRADDPTAALAANRLLASWGRDARELQLVVRRAGTDLVDHHAPAPGQGVDHHAPAPGQGGRTLLHRLQADIRDDRVPPAPDDGDARPRLDPDDCSIQVHSCHGRARQVEVLRDAVLHLLDDDPTLEPRDVIVMCPDIETFAPLIEATFGAGRVVGGDDQATDDADAPGRRSQRLPDLRVRLADRSLRQTNPVLGVVSQLLALADQRGTASELLDLAATGPVRHRFRFDDDELARMQDWVGESGIRWGFDAAHRAPFKLDGLKANTWSRGLDRILVGVTMSEEERRLVADTVLPLDDVESGAIELAGRFAEYIERARAAVDELTQPQPLHNWATAIAHAADALTATSERDSWQRRELQRMLDDVVADSASGSGAILELADVRALLADRLRGRPTRANFRTGHLTVCTLVPMRSVPHRVVCVLGLDDGEFPRRAWRDGDDLMLQDPHVGDRDPRTEDRQMLLDALMAAGERLIITYTGNDERTNLRRPPAVPVGELLDTIDATVRTDDGPAREQVLVRHPLQPFDPRNFASGTPWGFDPQSLAGARALTGPRRPVQPFLTEPLPAPGTRVIELDRLVSFVERPVRALLRDRLGVSVFESFDEIEDAIPVELDKLEEWQVGQALLEGVLGGGDLGDCVRAEQARGLLPPGELARSPLQRIAGEVQQLISATRTRCDGTPESLEVNVELPDGRRLAGTVTGVCGETIRTVSYSRVRARDRLRAWVRLLALTASRPERPFESIVIGRARSDAYRSDLCIARIPPLGGDLAIRQTNAMRSLAAIIDLYDRGMREPLLLACDTSAAYAQAAVTGADGLGPARKTWESTYGYDKEDRQPEHLLAFGRQLPFDELVADVPRADERGPGWNESEASRFGRYARRLWDDLLAAEGVEDL
ncbi:MAG TPA: exodeoxyribonuclease V subunit gamma [Solirubrobacteraceae bacterium]